MRAGLFAAALLTLATVAAALAAEALQAPGPPAQAWPPPGAEFVPKKNLELHPHLGAPYELLTPDDVAERRLRFAVLDRWSTFSGRDYVQLQMRDGRGAERLVWVEAGAVLVEVRFTGNAEFHATLGAGYELVTPQAISDLGLRFFALGIEMFQGKPYTKVRVRSRQGVQRTGWIDKLPPAPATAPSGGTSLPPGVIGAVVGALPMVPPPPPPPPDVLARRAALAGKEPKRIKHVPPVYPPIAQSARVQGVVIVEATIGSDGKVTDARIGRSIPLLDQAALDAVRQWEFEPTVLNGEAIPVTMSVLVQFTLSDPAPAEPQQPPAEQRQP
jgi:TonB family protein